MFLDQTLVLQNALTGEERECRIVFTDRNRIGPIEVGLEFRNPAPYFWRVAFPPDDWILPELRFQSSSQSGKFDFESIAFRSRMMADDLQICGRGIVEIRFGGLKGLMEQSA